MIWEFVAKNKDKMKNQLQRLGFLLNWSTEQFPLDNKIIKIVYQTFKKLFDQGLVYRKQRLVNYCLNCGTSFSDLEVEYQQRLTKLYYIHYFLVKKLHSKKLPLSITIATTRPETLLGDVAVAVNPKDKRYRQLIGEEVILPLINRKIPIIADLAVDPKFATGAVKVTPAHDETDWEISQRHHLPLIQVIGFNGKMTQEAGRYVNLTIAQARTKILADLQQAGLLEKEEDYLHRVGRCYKCNRIIEPLPKEQWFIKIKPLRDQAISLLKTNKIKMYPPRFKKIAINILKNFYDWNISRQIVWGIRIPAYQCSQTKKWFVAVSPPKKCEICGGKDFIQDSDTFDTWFSSSQWPFATLQAQSQQFFERFYPTTVMETGYDILRAWVVRMIMIGYFVTGVVPFKNIFLHGLVRDKLGRKMSKSKGNVINPLIMIDKYGADALRAALVFGVKEGNDVILSEEKIIGMRNFANKIWNIGRLIKLNSQIVNPQDQSVNLKTKSIKTLKKLTKEFEEEKKKYFYYFNTYQFAKGLELVYQFLWHRFADYYLEELKDELIDGKIEVLRNLQTVYFSNLQFLHPFMPFVTEAVWQQFHQDNTILESKIKK
jgi:valyl-tRNA synthetase